MINSRWSFIRKIMHNNTIIDPQATKMIKTSVKINSPSIWSSFCEISFFFFFKYLLNIKKKSDTKLPWKGRGNRASRVISVQVSYLQITACLPPQNQNINDAHNSNYGELSAGLWVPSLVLQLLPFICWKVCHKNWKEAYLWSESSN